MLAYLVYSPVKARGLCGVTPVPHRDRVSVPLTGGLVVHRQQLVSLVRDYLEEQEIPSKQNTTLVFRKRKSMHQNCNPSRHKIFVLHLYHAGTTSKTLGRRCINVIQVFVDPMLDHCWPASQTMGKHSFVLCFII